jgi:hypothetical protein
MKRTIMQVVLHSNVSGFSIQFQNEDITNIYVDKISIFYETQNNNWNKDHRGIEIRVPKFGCIDISDHILHIKHELDNRRLNIIEFIQKLPPNIYTKEIKEELLLKVL